MLTIETKRDVIATLMQANRPDLANMASTVLADEKLPLEYFLFYLSHKLTQWDQRESIKEMKRGRVNIYRLGLLLEALERVRQNVARIKKSTDPADLAKLKDAIEHHFTDFPPRRQTLKAIETYLQTGKRPKITATAATRKLDSGLRQKINRDLEKAGFDGNGRFRKIGEALSGIAKVLNRHGLQQGEVFDANLFRGTSGQRSFDIEFVNPDDSFSPEAISNSMLAIQWSELRPGTLEVLAYLS